VETLATKAPKKLRPYWTLLWREERDPFAALEELRAKLNAGALSDADATELARLERVTPGYQDDLNL